MERGGERGHVFRQRKYIWFAFWFWFLDLLLLLCYSKSFKSIDEQCSKMLQSKEEEKTLEKTGSTSYISFISLLRLRQLQQITVTENPSYNSIRIRTKKKKTLTHTSQSTFAAHHIFCRTEKVRQTSQQKKKKEEKAHDLTFTLHICAKTIFESEFDIGKTSTWFKVKYILVNLYCCTLTHPFMQTFWHCWTFDGNTFAVNQPHYSNTLRFIPFAYTMKCEAVGKINIHFEDEISNRI